MVTCFLAMNEFDDEDDVLNPRWINHDPKMVANVKACIFVFSKREHPPGKLGKEYLQCLVKSI